MLKKLGLKEMIQQFKISLSYIRKTPDKGVITALIFFGVILFFLFKKSSLSIVRVGFGGEKGDFFTKSSSYVIKNDLFGGLRRVLTLPYPQIIPF